jgi:membrane protease YdiL (CAAX protease family)
MTPRRSATVAIASTVVLYSVYRALGWLELRPLQTPWSEGVLKLGVWALPSVAVLCLVWRQSVAKAVTELGLATNPLVGYGFALAASLPMLVGPAHGFVPTLHASAVAGTVLLAPITEEILFRGLLFRQLYHRAGRPLLRAMLVSALAFACAHLTPADFRGMGPLTPLAGQVAMTTIVGLVLAWLVYRWDSVWPAIGMHACLNLSWELYGSGLANGPKPFPLRAASIGLAILLTLWFTKGRSGSRGMGV